MINTHLIHLPRLYVTQDLQNNGTVRLDQAQSHYLGTVLRKNTGDQVRLFNGHDGEWLACITASGRKIDITLEVQQNLRPQTVTGHIDVIACLVKKDALALMVEKSCELGAMAFIPVTAERSNNRSINHDRLQSIATEAAEQCERLDIMQVEQEKPLLAELHNWCTQHPDGKIIFCRERSEAPAIHTVLSTLPALPRLALLVGPEGGFSSAEITEIENQASCIAASLGPRILRAETALIAGLACLQAQCGDW